VEHIDFLVDFVVGNSNKLQNLGEPSMCSRLGQWHMLHYYIYYLNIWITFISI